MNISYRWLQSIAPGLQGTPQELAERLAMLGAPVDEIVDLGGQIGDVVIARVDDVRQHPNVFRAVGYDPEKYTGYAFGMGPGRIAMQRYGLPDIRLLYESDMRFLRQFV